MPHVRRQPRRRLMRPHGALAPTAARAPTTARDPSWHRGRRGHRSADRALLRAAADEARLQAAATRLTLHHGPWPPAASDKMPRPRTGSRPDRPHRGGSSGRTSRPLVTAGLPRPVGAPRHMRPPQSTRCHTTLSANGPLPLPPRLSARLRPVGPGAEPHSLTAIYAATSKPPIPLGACCAWAH